MPIPIPLPDDFATSLAVAPVGDGEHFVQAVLHAPTASTSEIAHVVCYLISYKTWWVSEIGRSEPLGKDVAGAVLIIPGSTAARQTVILLVTEATPGGPGASAHENAYVFPDAVQGALSVVGPRGPQGIPGPQGPAGAGVQGLAQALVAAAAQFD